MARSLVDLLVPDIEAARDVPDGLSHRQHRQSRTGSIFARLIVARALSRQWSLFTKFG